MVTGRPEPDGEALLVDFYGRKVPARVVDGDFTEAISRYAGHEVRLARPDRPGDALDVRPVTLVSLESVAELAKQGRHDGTLNPGRFRMTIEIEGVSRPHEEDSWAGREVRVGGGRFGPPGVPECSGAGRCGQASKGVWGMSWRREAVGRGRRRNAWGSCQTSFDPRVPGRTRGTETSHYPQEEKATAIPSVAASERGPAQTGRHRRPGL